MRGVRHQPRTGARPADPNWRRRRRRSSRPSRPAYRRYALVAAAAGLHGQLPRPAGGQHPGRADQERPASGRLAAGPAHRPGLRASSTPSWACPSPGWPTATTGRGSSPARWRPGAASPPLCGVGAELRPAGRRPRRRRHRRGRLHAHLPRADRRLHAQGQARLGAGLLLHGHAARLAAGPGHGRG